jgi:hypothetical protein
MRFRIISPSPFSTSASVSFSFFSRRCSPVSLVTRLQLSSDPAAARSLVCSLRRAPTLATCHRRLASMAARQSDRAHSFPLRLRQIDASLTKLRWPLCEPTSAPGAFFRWRRWVDHPTRRPFQWPRLPACIARHPQTRLQDTQEDQSSAPSLEAPRPPAALPQQRESTLAPIRSTFWLLKRLKGNHPFAGHRRRSDLCGDRTAP